MCMCLLLLPSSDLTLGKMPLHLTLLSGLTSKELSLGFKNIQRPGAEVQSPIPPRVRLEKECFFHLPNILPFQCTQTADRVGQQQARDEWPDSKTRDFLAQGPKAQAHHYSLSHQSTSSSWAACWGNFHWMGPSLTQL